MSFDDAKWTEENTQQDDDVDGDVNHEFIIWTFSLMDVVLFLAVGEEEIKFHSKSSA